MIWNLQFGIKDIIAKQTKEFGMKYIFLKNKKKHYPSEKEIQENFDANLIDGKGFKGISLWNFEEDNQITFFVQNEEEEWTFDKMTDMFY
jgi:hypothetical protein